MKKLLLFIPVILLFFSCGKDDVYYEGDTIIYEGARVSTQYIAIYPNDWQQYSDPYRQYMYASFNISQINSHVIDKGAVICYFIGSDGFDKILPYSVTSFVDDVSSQTYTNRISFEIAPNRIDFLSEDSELLFDSPNHSIQIKIVIIQNP